MHVLRTVNFRFTATRELPISKLRSRLEQSATDANRSVVAQIQPFAEKLLLDAYTEPVTTVEQMVQGALLQTFAVLDHVRCIRGASDSKDKHLLRESQVATQIKQSILQ